MSILGFYVLIIKLYCIFNWHESLKGPIFVVHIGLKICQKNGYIPYESGILVCLLGIFWSLANENHIFVVFNELIDVQNPQC